MTGECYQRSPVETQSLNTVLSIAQKERYNNGKTSFNK